MAKEWQRVCLLVILQRGQVAETTACAAKPAEGNEKKKTKAL